MMKNVTAIALTGLVCLSACTPRQSVEGSWPEGAGKTVYLQQKVNDEKRVLDSVVVAADGAFGFTLPEGSVGLYVLNVANEGSKELFLSDAPVTVSVATGLVTSRDSSTREELKIEAVGDEQQVYEMGTQLSMTAAFMQLGRMFTFSNILNGKDTTMSLDSAALFFDMMSARIDSAMYHFVDSARNNYAVTCFIKDYLMKNAPFDSVQKVFDNLTDRVKQSAPGIELAKQVEALASVSMGGTAPDITLPTPDGGELSLSSLRGHYVLLDFWASWCGPCLREVPNVKAIYEKYHDKGFEVFGVSLDETAGPWKAAIKKNNMNWHHVSSLKGWECPVAKLYNVTGIPRMYIIDPEGKIIAQDLRGEELAKFVDGLYE